MKRSIITFPILILLALPRGVAQEGPSDSLRLSLQDALRIGLEKNFDLQIFENNVAIAENNATHGNAGFLPNLDLNASQNWEVENVNQQFIERPANTIRGAESNTLRASADFSWTIFDGLGMFRRYDQLSDLKTLEQLFWQQEAELLISNIVTSYYQVVLEARKLQVLQETMDISKDRLVLARDKYEVGKGSKLEYLDAQVDYNEDSSALMTQLNSVLQSRIDLNTFLARSPQAAFSITDTIPELRSFDLEELKALTDQKNASLEILQKDQNISMLEIQRIQAERWPRISVIAGYSYQRLNSEAGFLLSNRTDGFQYGLTATMPVFNGANLNRRIQNAKIAERNSQLALEAQKLDVTATLESNYAAHQRALAIVQLERQNLNVAKENAEIAFERYRLGKSNPLELREAQINAQDAETRLLDAVFAAKVLEIELIRISGQIMQRVKG